MSGESETLARSDKRVNHLRIGYEPFLSELMFNIVEKNLFTVDRVVWPRLI